MIKKLQILPFIVLPFVDNLTGYLDVGKFSFYFRIIFMAAFFIIAVNGGTLSRLIFFLWFVFSLLLSLLLPVFSSSGELYFSTNITSIVKLLYTPILIWGFIELGKEYGNELVLEGIFIGSYIYIFFILISAVLGIGLTSYASFGVTGFMKAGNDVSHAIAISLPVSFIYMTKRFPYITALGMTALGMVALLLLGTKSGILGIIAVFVLIIVEDRKRPVTLMRVILWYFFFLLIWGAIILVIPLVRSVITQYVILFEEYGILGVFFRGRQNIFYYGRTLIEDLSLREIFTGIGIGRYGDIYAELSFDYWKKAWKTAEMDIFDVFLSYGVVGWITVYCFYIRQSFKLLKTRKLFLILPLLIYWIHSTFAGHAMGTPIVGTFMAAIFSLTIEDFDIDRKNFLT